MHSSTHCLRARSSVEPITMYESKLKCDKVLGPFANTYISSSVWYSINALKSIPATFVGDQFVPFRLFEHCFFSFYL